MIQPLDFLFSNEAASAVYGLIAAVFLGTFGSSVIMGILDRTQRMWLWMAGVMLFLFIVTWAFSAIRGAGDAAQVEFWSRVVRSGMMALAVMALGMNGYMVAFYRKAKGRTT